MDDAGRRNEADIAATAGPGIDGWDPVAELVAARFEGEGSGVGPLTWGQRALWDAMRRQQSWFPQGAVLPLPAGTALDDVVGQLRYLMGRYQTLRTRLRLDPDEPKQVVSAAGEVVLEVYDASPDTDPATFAQRLEARYWAADYDFVTQWPIRMAVVRHCGALTHQVVTMCHLVTDAAGGQVMWSELAARPSGPVTAMQPLEQARWQRSPAGKRQSAAAMRHCERALRTVPARRFPIPAGRPRPRYWYATFTSRALHLAVLAIAARTEVAPATVLLAMLAIAMARVTGDEQILTMPLVSNRFRPRLAESVSPINHAVPCVIEVDGIVDEVVTRAHGRVMAAYKNGYYDTTALDEVVRRVNQERGVQLDVACYVNDRRGGRPALPAGPPPTPDQVRAALPETTFGWKTKQDEKPYERFFLHVEDVPDTVALSLFIDVHYLAPADLEACVRSMEAVAVAAALDPDTPAKEPST